MSRIAASRVCGTHRSASGSRRTRSAAAVTRLWCFLASLLMGTLSMLWPMGAAWGQSFFVQPELARGDSQASEQCGRAFASTLTEHRLIERMDAEVEQLVRRCVESMSAPGFVRDCDLVAARGTVSYIVGVVAEIEEGEWHFDVRVLSPLQAGVAWQRDIFAAGDSTRRVSRSACRALALDFLLHQDLVNERSFVESMRDEAMEELSQGRLTQAPSGSTLHPTNRVPAVLEIAMDVSPRPVGVRVNGIEAGVGPGQIIVPANRPLDVEIHAVGHVVHRQELEIQAGETLILRGVHLDALPATMSVASNVQDALIQWQGLEVGRTTMGVPVTMTVSPGHGTLRVARDGFVPVELELEARSGSHSAHQVLLFSIASPNDHLVLDLDVDEVANATLREAYRLSSAYDDEVRTLLHAVTNSDTRLCMHEDFVRSFPSQWEGSRDRATGPIQHLLSALMDYICHGHLHRAMDVLDELMKQLDPARSSMEEELLQLAVNLYAAILLEHDHHLDGEIDSDYLTRRVARRIQAHEPPIAHLLVYRTLEHGLELGCTEATLFRSVLDAPEGSHRAYLERSIEAPMVPYTHHEGETFILVPCGFIRDFLEFVQVFDTEDARLPFLIMAQHLIAKSLGDEYTMELSRARFVNYCNRPDLVARSRPSHWLIPLHLLSEDGVCALMRATMP